MSYKITPGSFRLPVLNSKEAIDKVDYLSEEDKAFAKSNLGKVSPTDGWYMLGSNPHMQAYWELLERECYATLQETQMEPFKFMTTSLVVMAKKMHCEYGVGLMFKNLLNCVQDQNIEFGMDKVLMLDFPDSEFWAPEERLCIKFTEACLDNTMTDELFQEAIDTWGESRIIGYLSWIAYGWFWFTLENVLGMNYKPSMVLDKLDPEDMPPMPEKPDMPDGAPPKDDILGGIVNDNLYVKDAFKKFFTTEMKNQPMYKEED